MNNNDLMASRTHHQMYGKALDEVHYEEQERNHRIMHDPIEKLLQNGY